MADFSQLKAAVANVIKTNGNEEITGAILQDVLLTIINSIAGGYMFGGVAQHSGNVGNPDYNVFYLAGSGSYTGYGSAITIEDGCYGVFRYNGSWTQEVVDIGVRLSGSVTVGETRGCTGDTINSALQQLFDNITSILDTMAFTYNTPSAQQATKAMLDVQVTVGGNAHVLGTLTLVAATALQAGLMSAEDKQTLDGMLNHMAFEDTTAGGDVTTKITEALKVTIGGNAETLATFTLLAATASKAGLMSADDKVKFDALVAMLGYYVCDTAAGTAAKTISATGYTLTNGGCIRIKMTYGNTASGVTLNINGTGAKNLYYDGAQASSSNSWDAGDVLEVFYDGTQYQCASGGGGKFATGEKVKETSITDEITPNSDDLPTSGAVAGEIDNLKANIGYFTCDTEAATAAKVVAATGYKLTIGGNILIKMTNENSADNATLNINSTGAKALFYNGVQASSSNSWGVGEVLVVYYDGTQYQARKTMIKELELYKPVVFEGGMYFNKGGYYNSSFEVVSNNYFSYSNPIDVSDYVGLIAYFNFTSGGTNAYSCFKDENNNIISTFRGLTQVLIPDGAKTLLISASGSDAALKTVTINVLATEEDLTALINGNPLQAVLLVQSETATATGYYKPDHTIGSGGYHLNMNVEAYRGCKVVFKPCWDANTFTGFQLSDDSYLAIPVSGTSDFEYVVPNNAVKLMVSYQTSQTDRYVTFYVEKTLNDIYSELLSRALADQLYVSKEVLKIQYDLDTEEVAINRYYDSNGALKSANGFYAFKIADFTDFHNSNWIGGTYKIGGHLYTGGVARCGIINADNSITLILSSDQYQGEITSSMKGLFVSWNNIEDAVVELKKYDTDIATQSDIDLGVAQANAYTDQKMAEAGLLKLPNKKWFVLGDSISAYTLYVGAGNHYYEFIAARNNMTFDPTTQVYAADGRTISATTNNSICYDVASLSGAQIITILAGINDFGHNIPLGTLVDNDGYCVAPPATAAECTDFAKGLLYVLSNLRTNYPKAVLIFILPMRNNRMQENTLGLRLEKYWEYIYKACEAYAVPVIELGKACSLMNGGTYFGDGLHPNIMGQKIMSYYIENYMSLMVPTEWT